MTLRRFVDFAIAGTLWGGFAYLLGVRAFGRPIWGGVLAGPIIGLIVGAVLQSPFERQTGLRRAVLALASLYLAASLFGLAIGFADTHVFSAGTGSALRALAAEVLAVWWGVTLTGFLLFLWPLAYGTHWLLEFREGRV